MKYIYIFILMLPFILAAQNPILTENFNTTVPANWTQNPASTWSIYPSLGTASSNCIGSEDLTMNTPTNSIFTPTLSLVGVSNLTVTFKVALIGNNFIVPNIVLSYNTGTGPQFLARWGSGYTANTTYTVTDYGYNYQPPLLAQNVHWVSCTHTLSAISGSAVTFNFDAEIVNGGYVLIDDVVISGKNVTTGITENKWMNSISVFPNPVTHGKLTLAGDNISRVALIDPSGRRWPLIYTKSETFVEADLSGFAAGIYYIEMLTSSNTLTCEKIILSH